MDTVHSNHAWEFVSDLLGLGVGPEELSLVQMAVRAFVVFVWLLVLLRVANQRVIGRASGGDVMLLVVLGSVLSRAVNGAANFFPTLGASLVLVLLYRVLMAAAFKFHVVSLLAKGSDCVLVRNGQIEWEAMRRSRVTIDDLLEHVRQNGNTTTIEEVREARLERSGEISIVRRNDH